MIELFNNKILFIAGISLLSIIVYKYITRRSKEDIAIENEYNEVLNSEKYRVKGQF
ncbi:hypothetical protein J4476_04805 [Candidatus Woesearchaeota archaeon]|nr:MAG: hypothetical protein QT09_C0004G0025 [archaeon GW2011_AR18]MBS3161983.1 hypothetical protein [Candidatus Woesearchaeota archaeon]HIH25858.1 hypothetical protein [Nanoarchaeota archaeon]